MTASHDPASAAHATPILAAARFDPVPAAETASARRVALLVKRAADVAGALVGLGLLWPVLVLVAIVVLVVDGRPVLFVQRRVGHQGRVFRLVKFRTMVRDAEDRFADLAPLSETRGAAFKMTNDPRVTRLGRFLRRSSIDELPQLWNVLRGEMSLVGPRPAMPREVDCYAAWHRRRLSMKPGMTGLWQVASRFDADFDARASFDLAYIDRWSLLLDVVILLRTVRAVLALTGR